MNLYYSYKVFYVKNLSRFMKMLYKMFMKNFSGCLLIILRFINKPLLFIIGSFVGAIAC